jgi:hypothetical protein
MIGVIKTLGHATAPELWKSAYQTFWRDVVRAFKLQQALKAQDNAAKR